MIPPFLMGVMIFVLILLMFQALRLTEFVLVHGVKISTVLEIMGYLSTSFLPILFPMSLMFTILMTYGRLSADSELVAMKSIGVSMWHIAAPTVILSVITALISLQTSFHIAPWGNRQFEILIGKVGASKPAATLREGTFAEGFFNLVVYANKVDSKTGKLKEIFIFDERNDIPTTVIAKDGAIEQDTLHPGNQASLRLANGSIHKSEADKHTKIDFQNYDIFLSDPLKDAFREKSPPSFTIDELKVELERKDLGVEDRISLLSEYHKRWALGLACPLFALLGVGLGSVSNRRSGKSSGMVMSVGMIVAYWILYVTGEGLARSQKLAPGLAMWIANTVFAFVTIWAIRRSWKS